MTQRFTNPYQRLVISRRKHPASIGWVDKLYEFPHYNKKQLNFEALFFRRLDQSTSNLFDRLIGESAPTLTALETETLGVFLTSLMHRTPAGIEAMRELSKYVLDNIHNDVRDRFAEVRGDDDPMIFEEYEAGLGPDAHLDHFSGIFRTVAVSERMANFFARLHWRKVNFSPSEHSLLMSDDPLIRTNGIAIPEGHVAIPLTPRMALVGTYIREYFDQIASQPPKEIVRAMNIQMVESARHFVVDLDEQQARFITNRFGRNPRPTVSEQSLRDRLGSLEEA